MEKDDLTITVKSPPRSDGNKNYTKKFDIENWAIGWNQMDFIRFYNGQQFDVAYIIELENSANETETVSGWRAEKTFKDVSAYRELSDTIAA